MNEPVPCAGVVIVEDDAILLVRRGNAPSLGQWSLPAGRCEPGEEPRATAAREAREEIGVEVRVSEAIGTALISGDDGQEYFVTDFRAERRDREVPCSAGSDASEVAFVPLVELAGFNLVDGLFDWLVRHAVIGS